MFRLEKDAPAALDDLQAFDGKAIAQSSHNNPIDCNTVTVIDTLVAHGIYVEYTSALLTIAHVYHRHVNATPPFDSFRRWKLTHPLD